MGTAEVGAVVVGAGIAGLSAALELQRTVGEVVLLDASDRPGGVMRTEHRAGYVFEQGPNTTQVKAPFRALLEREVLGESLRKAEPASRLRFLYRDGGLVPVPMSPLAFARTPLLSRGAKWRLLAEPFVRRGDPSGESVAEFTGRRLGGEVAGALVGPFLTGVYAGDETELGAEAVFPGLVDLERRFGSIALGGLLGAFSRKGGRGLRGSYAGQKGFGPFARELAERLVEPPALGTAVSMLRREGEAWHLSVASGAGADGLRTSRVVLATPAAEAAQVMIAHDPELAELLAGIDYVPVVAVPLGVDPARVRTPIEGFGFLVPRDAGLGLLGCLFMSQLFPNRAPEGRALLHCMLGGRRWPEALDEPDDVLVARLCEDLDRTLGLEGDPQTLAVARWPRAIPQPGRDHVRRMAAIRERLAEAPGLALAGAYVNGVSVADAAASGIAAARELAG